jgi:hypothetical protein
MLQTAIGNCNGMLKKAAEDVGHLTRLKNVWKQQHSLLLSILIAHSPEKHLIFPPKINIALHVRQFCLMETLNLSQWELSLLRLR